MHPRRRTRLSLMRREKSKPSRQSPTLSSGTLALQRLLAVYGPIPYGELLSWHHRGLRSALPSERADCELSEAQSSPTLCWPPWRRAFQLVRAPLALVHPAIGFRQSLLDRLTALRHPVSFAHRQVQREG